MRVVVDLNRCEANALCMGVAPEVFELTDDDELIVLTSIPTNPCAAESRKPSASARAKPSRSRRIPDMSTATADLYYDPYDFEIDADPYPVWKRMRDEQPLYYNEKHDFWAVTRWDDVEAALKDHGRLISSHGTILELIKANITMPPGMVIFDDPPSHTAYRGLMSRVFTPRKMNAIEPEVRRYCQIELDALEGQSEFDIVEVLAAKMPMRVIGMLLGIPEGEPAGDPRLDRQWPPPRLVRRLQQGVQGLQRIGDPGPVRRVPRLADRSIRPTT